MGVRHSPGVVLWRRLDVPGHDACRPVRDGAAVLQPLDQRYERRADDAYRYEAPGVGYAATLLVRDDGFVREYPGLWVAE